MTANYKRIGRLFLLINLLLLTACSAAPADAPTQVETPDLGVVRTSAAQTVVAGFTQTAQANPTATIAPTIEPPMAEPPTATTTAPPTLTPEAPVLPTATSTRQAFVVYPSATPTYYTDRAQLVDQSPKDYSTLSPSIDFDAIWTVKNVGARKWNTEFYYRYKSGLKSSKQNLYFLQNDVGVNNDVKLIVDMIAPKEPGNYTSTWELINDDGVAFATFTLIFTVS